MYSHKEMFYYYIH